jgi:hypothetical protein
VAFLYVGLGMGSSHNVQWSWASAIIKFQQWLLQIFVFLHSPNGPYIDVHMFTMFYNALKPGTNAVVSNIICLCNSHIMHNNNKNMCVHGIMQILKWL